MKKTSNDIWPKLSEHSGVTQQEKTPVSNNKSGVFISQVHDLKLIMAGQPTYPRPKVQPPKNKGIV